MARIRRLSLSPKEEWALTDRAFRISLYLKGLDGLLELAGGILLLLVKPETIDRLAHTLTQHELSQDPHDFIANHILKSAHELSGASLIFGAVYLLSHGIVKLVLVVEVLRDRLWAYIALIAVLTLFVVYQVYRMAFVRFGLGLLALTLFDLLIIYLTRKEYYRHRRRTA